MNKLAIFFALFAILFALVSSFPTNIFEKRQKGNQISRSSDFTYFWVAYESDFKSTKKTDIKTCGKKTIETVDSDFAKSLRIEGSGITKSGKVINLGGE